MAFLQSQPRSNTPRTPRIVLLGPTGSGKGVQASLLANKYNLVKGQCQGQGDKTLFSYTIQIGQRSVARS
jgi:ABC-type transport system involved in cytochrome bd biosynthesis fused ATPase/permease subunit